MKSNYERNRFIIKYWIVAVVMLLCLFLAIRFAYGFDNRLIIIMGIFAGFLILLFFVIYRQLGKAYDDMEIISESMNSVIENGMYPDEVYREGTAGVLYSNYYKMVRALMDSRDRVLDEKKFLRDIISDISHQLKTPLASLNVFIDLLVENKLPGDEERRKVLCEAQNQLSRMEWMVMSMLKLARIEAGAVEFEKKETNVFGMLSEAVGGVRVLTDKKKQNLKLTCDESCTMNVDSDWLIEAITNLLKNASDYSEHGTNIELRFEDNNVCQRIYVIDEGNGIEEKELPNIFKRFYRVKREVNPNSVGIGLSLTKSIVNGMGGGIRVDSEIGKGTCFTITFLK